MKNSILILFIVLKTTALFSQNLVLNPGFEQNSVVPGSYATYNTDVNSWQNPSNATPDYYNVSIPGYIVSDPQPHSGNAFAGLLFIAGSTTPNPNWREYLQGELSEPLTANTTYCIEFYINHRNSDVIGVQNVEIHFSNDLINESTNSIISYTAHASMDISAFDTTTWRKLTAQYTAAGGEQYFTVGNFDPSAVEIVYYQPLYYPVAYYYMDDFSIYDCNSSPTTPVSSVTTACSDLKVPNAFSPNADGHNDVFGISGWSNCVSKFNIMIFNRWGEKVFQSFEPSFQWNGIHNKSQLSIMPDAPLNSEVLVYCITATLNTGEEIIRKGNISVIR